MFRAAARGTPREVAPLFPQRGSIDQPDDEGSFKPRDKPLSFHWRAPEFDCRDIGLPKPKSRKHELAQQSIVLDLALEAQGQDREISYSRRHDWWSETRRYRGGAYTYSTVVSSIDALAAEGLVVSSRAAPRRPSSARSTEDFMNAHLKGISRQLGIDWKPPKTAARGLQSTVRATDALVMAVAPTALIYDVGETVRLRDQDKRLAGYHDTNQTLRWRRSLSEINEALKAAEVALPGAEQIAFDGLRVATDSGKHVTVYPHRNQLFRVFNADWRHGGRLYGPWWQQLPKAWRERLQINGASVSEPDYPSHHPSILYALVGECLVSDPYEVAGFDRALAKVALNVMFNARTPRAATYAIAREIERIERDDPDYDGLLVAPTAIARARSLVAALRRRHPKISKHFASGIGTHLQYLDSLMAERVVLTLMRRHGCTVLPIHDSFVVAERDEGHTSEAMQEAFVHVLRGQAA